jgi:uncharacterized protein (TIGR04222 family)
MNPNEMIGKLIVPNTHNTIALAIYGILLVVVIRIAVRYRNQALERMNRPHASVTDLSMEELAFLSGGGQRLMQLAAFRLFVHGLLRPENKLFQQQFVPVSAHDFDTNCLSRFEQTLYATSCVKNRLVTMAEPKLRLHALPWFEQIETKLAIAGYRLKESERSSLSARTIVPFLLLIAVGGVRIVYGMSHGYPVLYLVLLVILTFVIGIMVAFRLPKITRTGVAFLSQEEEKLRTVMRRMPSQGDRKELACQALALSGVVGLMAFKEYQQIQGALQSLSAGGGGDSSGGSGCGSSGCGSSGCGSSGCGGGGCGGGGD